MEISEHGPNKPVECVVSKKDLPKMRKVAADLGISVQAKAKAGETYIPGSNYRLPKGEVFVEIRGGSGEYNDLAEFWTNVREKTSQDS